MQKEHILEIAERIFFQKPYKEVKLDLIAHELKIQKPSLYHYFKNKKEILTETIKYSKEKFMLEFEKTITSKNLLNFIVWYIDFPLKTNNLFGIAYQRDFCEENEIRKIIFLGKQEILDKTKKFLSQKNLSEIQVYLFLNLLEKLSENNCLDKYCLKYSLENLSEEILKIFKT